MAIQCHWAAPVPFEGVEPRATVLVSASDRWDQIRDCLRKAGISFDAGLTSGERRAAELRFGFRFPPDLGDFLGGGLPVGDRWPNWRAPGPREAQQLEWPFDGMCFDIEHNKFWHS